MSDLVKITLNGKEVEVPANSTIREAAKSQGIEIPVFCYDDRLKPFASCFLCVVDVEKARTLLPACSTSVAPGMVIQTDNERVTKTRKMALDLLLSDHAGDCVAPCEATCPANVNIQGYIAHISNGNHEAAVRLIKKNNPLPVVCGRICPHPCEAQCRRGLVDEPVAINPLKRFASEYELEKGAYLPPVGADSGKKVAIVGGGPAGLSAAYFLRQAGHEVHIYEALPELGGMVRYGIPRFRLPWDKLDNEIKSIIDLGVHVHYNKRLGKDFTIADLKKDGADAVILAIGAHKAKPMRVENEDSEGVIGGVDFLRKVVLGEKVEVGKRVAVVGGGDSAMDCARVARRLGADVTLLYRRTQAEMPALPIEQEETIEEGVEFLFLTAPTSVVLENGKAKALKVITMELGEPDESGRRRPVPIEGSEKDMEFDLIISSIGQEPDVSCVDGEAQKPETTRWNTFEYDTKTMTTTVDGVFTAGDCAFGPETAIRAIGEGRMAAEAASLYLMGAKIELKKEYAISRGRIEELDMEDFSPRYQHKKRALESTHPAEQRLANGGYDAINVGIDEAQALAESTKCIECGCNARFDCDLRTYATEYGASEKTMVGDKRNHEIDERHPLIRIEADKCITCGSCVRVCSEVRGVAALTFINRGFKTHIAPNFEDPLQNTDCDACGMCIDLCPTGTMSTNTGKEAGPWLGSTSISTCTSCSRGCAIRIYSAEGTVVKVKSVDGDSVNNALICKDARFGFQLLNKRKTYTQEEIESALKNAQSILSASKKTNVIVSPKLSVEETFAAAQLAKAKGGNLYYVAGDQSGEGQFPFGKVEGEANVALLEKLGAKAWSNEQADCSVVVGAHLPAHSKTGGKVIALNAYASGVQTDVVLPLADPLETRGAFLNRDGNLARINTNADLLSKNSGHALLAQLAGMKEMEDLASLRQSLVQSVSEFSGLEKDGEDRLIQTGLVKLAAVAKDGRETAFQAHLKDKGL